MNSNQPKTMRSILLTNPVFCLRLLESQFYAKPLTTKLAGSRNVRPKTPRVSCRAKFIILKIQFRHKKDDSHYNSYNCRSCIQQPHPWPCIAINRRLLSYHFLLYLVWNKPDSFFMRSCYYSSEQGNSLISLQGLTNDLIQSSKI